MNLEIFTDSNQQNPLETNELIEDTRYFLKLTPHSPEAIALETESGFCSRYIDWVPINEIGMLYFHNVIGMVDLFGRQYEVKSKKFLSTQIGKDPFKLILNDIATISSGFIFMPASTASVSYTTNPVKVTNNLYYIYKYLIRTLFADTGLEFQKCMDLIVSNPIYVQRSSSEDVDVFLAKRYNVATFRKMVQRNYESLRVPSSHSLMKLDFIKALPKTQDGDGILPRKIFSSINRISFDTQENRFVLYFLKWSILVFRQVGKYYKQYQITKNCENAIKQIQRNIQEPLFRSVGVLGNIPWASSALVNRSGYKEIFHHYLKCREEPTLFMDAFNKYFLMMEIKDISLIYEYWVFFKTARAIFGEDAELNIFKDEDSNSKLKYGMLISDSEKKLFYNRTYTHSSGQSYSFNFRPDISLEINQSGITKKYFFDAKYSNNEIFSGGENLRSYKNENVTKMLVYLESISDSEAAVIVYPGNDFIFYEKEFALEGTGNRNAKCSNIPEDICNFRGVGAVPLSPGHLESEAVFSRFIEGLKQHILNPGTVK